MGRGLRAREWAFYGTQACVLVALLALCARVLALAYGDLQDYVSRCHDPFFLERLLQVADAEVTEEKRRAMLMLHDGVVGLSGYAADALGGAAGAIVRQTGWLVELQVGATLTEAQLYALQQMLAVTVAAEAFALDAVNRALALVKALSVAAVCAAAAMIACVTAHAIMLAAWVDYYEARDPASHPAAFASQPVSRRAAWRRRTSARARATSGPRCSCPSSAACAWCSSSPRWASSR